MQDKAINHKNDTDNCKTLALGSELALVRISVRVSVRVRRE